jgi:hypothetical protein
MLEMYWHALSDEASFAALSRAAIHSALQPGYAPFELLRQRCGLPASFVRSPGVPVHLRFAARAAEETQSECRLLSLPPELLRLVLAKLGPRSLVHLSLACTQLAHFCAASAPHRARLRIVTFNLKNNGVNRFTGQPSGRGCRVWSARCPIMAAGLAALRPSVLCAQEDDASMLSDLFSRSELFQCNYRAYPGARGHATPRVLLGEPGCEGRPFSETDARVEKVWEQGSILWDDDVLEFVDGGGYCWRDGRAVADAAAAALRTRAGENSHVHLIPCTWVLLRWRAADRKETAPGAAPFGSLLVVSAHIEAGHNWNEDVPAKRRSLGLINQVIAALRRRFGRHVQLLLGLDANAQKVQGYYRQDFLSANLYNGQPQQRPPPGCSLIDAFDAFQLDCPTDGPFDESEPRPEGVGTVGAPGALRVRTGGCNGTTWHDFKGRGGCKAVSESMKSSCQHRTTASGEEGVVGAVGHQRHIDHLLLSEEHSLAGLARVSRAWVDVKHCRLRGRCALAEPCGYCRGDKPIGSFASDHFPVCAEATLCFDDRADDE